MSTSSEEVAVIEEPVPSIISDFAKTLKGEATGRVNRGVPQVQVMGEFKRFKNIIHFVTDPEGLNLPTLWNFNRQYQYIRDFYSLMCPQCNTPGPNPEMPFDTWGKSPGELQEDVLFERNEAGHFECPKCGLLQSQAHIPNYKELIGVCGMRSGKTVLAAQILLYELHCDLLLDNPQKIWGLAPGQEVYYTVATTKGEQAKDTIFAAVDGLFSNSPWYIKYTAALKNSAVQQSVPVDRVYVKNLTEIRFLHKQLFIDLTGSNSAGIAGKTRKVCVVDEVARFTETDSRMGVDAVYDTLKASLLTLSRYGSKMICISSPLFKIDKIMRLKEESEKSIEESRKAGNLPSILIFHHSTWDFNPQIKFEDPFIQEEFRKNPTAAKRDFGADPPGALDPWIEEHYIDECVDIDHPCLVHTREYIHSLIVKGKQTTMIAKDIDSMVLDVPTTSHIAIACDPGHRMDSFGMILAYVRPVRTARGIEEHLFVGSVLDWVPKEKPRIEVDFRNVLDCIYRFKKHWILDKVVYDQWQSVLQIQDLQASGVDAEKIPLKKEDWDMLAALFYNRQIHLLHPKIGGKSAERLAWELKNLQLDERGKVDHSPYSSSDVAVCLARLAKVLVSGDHLGSQRALEERSMGFGASVRFTRP